MKTKIIILFLLTAALCIAQRRYYHETGSAILRVDENFPGAFVEHRTVSTGADNLFRAFLAFGDASGKYAYGSAHQYPPLSEGTFTLAEPPSPLPPEALQIEEFFDTVEVIDSHTVDSIWVYDTTYVYNLTESRTRFFYEDTAFGISVEQFVTAYYDTISAFYVDFIFTNTGSSTLSDLKTVFFYEGDVPEGGYRDDYPFSVGYLDAAAVRDGSEANGICSGFCALHPDTMPQLGAWFNWVDTLAEPDTANIISLLENDPEWPVSISPGDWAVYAMWDFGDLHAGATDTLRIALIAQDSTGFDSLAAYVRGDSVQSAVEDYAISFPEHHNISIAPNPFNSACEILVPEIPAGDASLEIFSMDGRIVRSMELSKQSDRIFWNARDDKGGELASGVYLVRFSSKGETISTAKAILIK